jgi:putative endonuclease
MMPFSYTPSRIWSRIVRKASAANLRRDNIREGTPETAKLGREGEEAAYWFLRDRGMIMVARNYRPEGLRGEIDLIGWEGDTLVFIEVKTRSSSHAQVPEAAVDRDKERSVRAAAQQYIHTARQHKALVRFDIVSVEITPGSPDPQVTINHLRDAFRY